MVAHTTKTFIKSNHDHSLTTGALKTVMPTVMSPYSLTAKKAPFPSKIPGYAPVELFRNFLKYIYFANFIVKL